jgi:hypothetical protein
MGSEHKYSSGTDTQYHDILLKSFKLQAEVLFTHYTDNACSVMELNEKYNDVKCEGLVQVLNKKIRHVLTERNMNILNITWREHIYFFANLTHKTGSISSFTVGLILLHMYSRIQVMKNMLVDFFTWSS